VTASSHWRFQATLTISERTPQRIDDLDIGKVLLVVSDNDAIVGLGNPSDDGVEELTAHSSTLRPVSN
jgi:hypothetical protein